MNRYDNARAQPAYRNQRFVDVHVGASADGNKRDVGFVYFAHQFEILLQGGVAEVINFDAADIQQNAGRLSERFSVGQKTAVHGIAELRRPPWILPGAADGYPDCLGPLFGAVFRQFHNRGNFGLIVLGNFDGVAEMILMPMRKKNVRSLDVGRFHDSHRRSGQKRVQHDAVFSFGNDKAAVSQIPDFNAFIFQCVGHYVLLARLKKRCSHYKNFLMLCT